MLLYVCFLGSQLTGNNAGLSTESSKSCTVYSIYIIYQKLILFHSQIQDSRLIDMAIQQRRNTTAISNFE